MEIIPAIDLKNGRCVRLLQGRDDATTEYSADPVATALDWVRQGARRLHVVNLDGAFGRASNNLEILRRIVAETDATIEFGGGLRTIDDMERAFATGIDKIVLGTVAVEDPDIVDEALLQFQRDGVIVALDAIDGKVATRGWKQVSERTVEAMAAELKKRGVAEILYTDIRRDGMLTGPDLTTLSAVAHTGVNVIASGGVGSKTDVFALQDLHLGNLTGVIIGKALYEKKVNLAELIVELDKRNLSRIKS